MRFITPILLISSFCIATVTGNPIEDVPLLSKKAFLADLLTVRADEATGVGENCRVSSANVDGTCFNIDTTCCNGFYTTGFCPGGNNIQCCTEIQQCSTGNGFCNDVNHVSCSVAYKRGLCPGPNNVQCCTGISGATKCTTGH